jgi:hypothetical protein
MRKVKFKKFICGIYPEGTNSSNQDKPGHYPESGTARYEKGFSEDGVFHGWGLDIIETNIDTVNYTVAIIEKQDGTIYLAIPTHIKFMEIP